MSIEPVEDIKLDDIILNIENTLPFEIIAKYPLLEEYVFTNEPTSQCNNIIIVIMVLRIRLGNKIKTTHPLYTTIRIFPEYIISPDLIIPELRELLNVCIYISVLFFQDNVNLTPQICQKLTRKMCKYIV
jgi:hypothetical protein